MYLAIDIETTGLDPERDQILEIAAVALDDHLHPRPLGFAPFHGVAMLEVMIENEYVRDMHRTSGLLDECEHSTFTGTELMDFFKIWLRGILPEGEKAISVGDSVHFDRSFLLPYLPDHLSHRVVDVSGMGRALRALGASLPPKTGSPPHRAMDDLRDSLRRLEEIRELVQS